MSLRRRRRSPRRRSRPASPPPPPARFTRRDERTSWAWDERGYLLGYGVGQPHELRYKAVHTYALVSDRDETSYWAWDERALLLGTIVEQTSSRYDCYLPDGTLRAGRRRGPRRAHAVAPAGPDRRRARHQRAICGHSLAPARVDLHGTWQQISPQQLAEYAVQIATQIEHG